MAECNAVELQRYAADLWRSVRLNAEAHDAAARAAAEVVRVRAAEQLVAARAAHGPRSQGPRLREGIVD